MKTIFSIIASLLLLATLAQTPQGIRYQAVLRDASGQTLTVQSAMVHFSILQGGPAGALTYQEEHTVFPDNLGMISLTIGNGYPLSGSFAGIDWAAGELYIKTELSTDQGVTYSDMGTMQLLSVPYALYAEHANSADESDPSSWKKTGNSSTNPATHFIGTTDASDLVFRTGNTEKMRLGQSGTLSIGSTTGNSNTSLYVGGNTAGGVVFTSGSSSPQTPPIEGAGSRTMWYPYKAAFRTGTVTSTYWNNDSIGSNSFAANWNTRATGSMSVAFGSATTASGMISFTAGINNTASGSYSTAFGNNLNAQSYNTFVIGRYNVADGSKTTWVSTDPLFVVGNGSSSASRNNALVVLKNGNTGIGVDAPATGIQLEVGDDYSGGNIVFNGGAGSPAMAPTGDGTRCMWIPAMAAFRAGYTDGNSWQYSDLGYASVAFGESNDATGTYSAAFGTKTYAGGAASFSCGNLSYATGENAFAGGYSSSALGANAFAFGYQNQADGDNSVTFGDVAYTYGDNAMALGKFTIARAYCSFVLGRNNVATGTNGSWVSTEPLIEAGNGASGSFNNAMTLYKNGNMTISGTLTQSSDIRLKTNIRPLGNTLSLLDLVQPIRYEFINQEMHPGGTQIGFSAQEIQKSWPELVREDASGYLSVDYAGMTVVLLQAVKEQQAMINKLENEIELLKQR